MSDLDNVFERLAALESEVALIRQEAAAARLWPPGQTATSPTTAASSAAIPGC